MVDAAAAGGGAYAEEGEGGWSQETDDDEEEEEGVGMVPRRRGGGGGDITSCSLEWEVEHPYAVSMIWKRRRLYEFEAARAERETLLRQAELQVVMRCDTCSSSSTLLIR